MDDSHKQRFKKYENSKYRWKNIGDTRLGCLPKSAVLVALFERDGAMHVWLTKRSMKVSREKGCVAFPGGMKEGADIDEVDTSLREAFEEIGLDPSLVDVAAVLPPHFARGSILVTPVVGFVSLSFQPKPNEEVDEVFSLPLARFLSDLRHDTMAIEIRNPTRNIHIFQDDVRGETLVTYGITAHICIEVAIACLQTPATFDYSARVNTTVDNPFALAEHDIRSFVSKL